MGSHLSSTPKFHTLSMSDTHRMGQKMKSSLEKEKQSGIDNASKSVEDEYFIKTKVTRARRQKNSETLSAPNLYVKNGYLEDDERSSEEYDSESYDALNFGMT